MTSPSPCSSSASHPQEYQQSIAFLAHNRAYTLFVHPICRITQTTDECRPGCVAYPGCGAQPPPTLGQRRRLQRQYEAAAEHLRLRYDSALAAGIPAEPRLSLALRALELVRLRGEFELQLAEARAGLEAAPSPHPKRENQAFSICSQYSLRDRSTDVIMNICDKTYCCL